MCRNWPVLANHASTILFFKLPTDVRMQRNVQWPNLLPEAVQLRTECVRRHIVIRTPHRAYICEPGLTRTLISEHNHSRVAFAHRRRNGVPAFPRALQLFGIAAGGHDVFEIIQRKAFPLRTVRAPLPFPVVALQRSIDLRQLCALRGVSWRRNVHGKLYKFELPSYIVR